MEDRKVMQLIEHLIKTSYVIPNEFHNSFFEIDFDALYQQGKRLILTDLDNTLISYQETEPTQRIREVFQKLQELGFEIILVSNNHFPRIEHFSKSLQIQGYANMHKPLLHRFKYVINRTKGYSLNQIVVIGDQVMTDIFGANRLGVYSILVNPLKRKTEKWYTKINRKIEEKMIQKIQKKHPDIYQNLSLGKRS